MLMAPRCRPVLLVAAVVASIVTAGCPAELGQCGDGRIDPGEECDDGNSVGGDGCSISCRRGGKDEDGDGFSTPEDCNDRLADVHPGAPELPCDGLDNDCAPETPDCPGGGDDGGADAGRDAGTEPPDAEAPQPDACTAGAETCADCLDQDCDGHDQACDASATIELVPAAPVAGQDVTVVASATTAFAWVLLAHEAPDGAREYLGCPSCSGQDGERFTWTYTLPSLSRGLHLVTFGRDYVDDDPAVGSPVVCAAIDVGQ